MAHSIEYLTEKLEEVKFNDDCFFSEHLSYEQEFLNKVKEKTQREIEDSDVSYFFNKRSMSIGFENLKTNESIAKQLLVKIDLLMDEYFFRKKGLPELGWCSKYLLDRRSVNYHKECQVFKKMK